MRRAVSRSALVDLALMAVLFAGAAWWGTRYVTTWREAGRAQLFYQEYFEPAVMLACGHGFAVATPATPPALADFLHQRVDRFDCASLPADLTLTSDGLVQSAWFYLMGTVALAWLVLGISWSGLAPVFGVLFGVVVLLAYAIFRVAMPAWVAAPAAGALIASALHLQNLPHLRDYAKAPFVLALVLILFHLVRRPATPRALVGLAALYGAILGVGYGVRTDLLANIPPLVLTVLLFLPGGVRAQLRWKAAALAAAAVTFLVVSWPATSFVVARGGCQWHVVLLGLDDRFTRDLRVTPGAYQWTSAFSDEYVHTAVNSFDRRTGGTGTLEYCSAAYDARSGAYYRAIGARFPADLVTRAYASVLRVLDLPFYWWHSVADEPDGPRRSAIGRVLLSVAGTARLAVVATVILIGAWNLRLGLFALCVVLYFGGYPSLQFANRHYFHLEFIGWFGMAFVGWQLLRLWRPDRHDWRQLGLGAARFSAIAAVLILAPVPALRAWQHREAAALVDTLLRAPRVPVPLQPAGEGRLDVPAGGLPGLEGDPTRTAYLDVRIDRDACPDGAAIDLRYAPEPAMYDFSAPVRPVPPGQTPDRVLVPVFRGFQGLGARATRCIAGVERLASVEGLPLLPVLTLDAGPRSGPYYQSLRGGWWR